MKRSYLCIFAYEKVVSLTDNECSAVLGTGKSRVKWLELCVRWIWTWREFTTLKAQQVLPNDRVTESCNRLQRLQWSLLVVLVFVVSASLDGKKMVGLLMVVPMLGCVPNVGLAFLKVCHFSAIGTNFL